MAYVKRKKRDYGAPPESRYKVTEAGCWEWQAGKAGRGYGVFRVKGTKKKMYAHRYFYEKYVGPIPAGLDIDHLCRNHCCVNPDHLEAVTHAENSRRGAMAKLNYEDVAQIRANPNGATMREQARQFGVSPSRISDIRNMKSWA